MAVSSDPHDTPGAVSAGADTAPDPERRPDLERDSWGADVSPTNDAALEAWERCILSLAGHRADTGEHLATVLAADPTYLPGICLKGFALLFKGRHDLREATRSVHEAAAKLATSRGATAREQSLVAVLGDWVADDLQGASARLARLTAEGPSDLFAIKLEHGCLFMQGRPYALLRAMERVLPAWGPSVPGYGYVLGCHAFALEETYSYEEAERVGRRAVAQEPDDAWGIHAVAHVMEMQDRAAEGVAWLKAHAPGYARCNNFRAHVYWHRALFHCELDQQDEALALYDAEVHNAWTGDYRDMSNRASLLWRLEADGVDVGERWEDLAARARERATDHGSAFADAHYVLALGRLGACEALVASLRAHTERGDAGDQATVSREVARPLCEAMSLVLRGRAAEAVDALEGLQRQVLRLGGSHAQRDLFEQFFIDASLRAGRTDLARAALARRLHHRPDNRWARKRMAGLGA